MVWEDSMGLMHMYSVRGRKEKAKMNLKYLYVQNFIFTALLAVTSFFPKLALAADFEDRYQAVCRNGNYRYEFQTDFHDGAETYAVFKCFDKYSAGLYLSKISPGSELQVLRADTTILPLPASKMSKAAVDYFNNWMADWIIESYPGGLNALNKKIAARKFSLSYYPAEIRAALIEKGVVVNSR